MTLFIILYAVIKWNYDINMYKHEISVLEIFATLMFS